MVLSDLIGDDPSDQRAIVEAKREGQAHIDDAAQNAVACGHGIRRGVAPMGIGRGEAHRFRRAEPFELNTPGRASVEHRSDRIIRPIQQQKLDG